MSIIENENMENLDIEMPATTWMGPAYEPPTELIGLVCFLVLAWTIVEGF